MVYVYVQLGANLETIMFNINRVVCTGAVGYDSNAIVLGTLLGIPVAWKIQI
jgi:hypothetical protein